MSYCVETLKEAFAVRQRVNASYSLRAFARDLQMNPGSLSSILKGQRRVPANSAEDLAAKLKLAPQKRDKFIRSIVRHGGPHGLHGNDATPSEPNLFEKDERHYRIIAEWEHYAVLNLMQTEDFISSSAWIAERLGIPQNRADVVLTRLFEAGLATVLEDGTMRRTTGSLHTTEDIRSNALRASHLDELEMARQKYDLLDPSIRDFSSVTVAADPRKLGQAKELIRRFRKDMAALLADGPQTEVYQLCLQLFPLTRSVARKDS